MLRDIAGIRLCGANFDEVTNILLLDPHEGNKVKQLKGLCFMEKWCRKEYIG